jgi:predicted dehydrogenase
VLLWTPKWLTVRADRRYDSDFRTLRQLVEKRALGEIYEAELRYDMHFPPWMRGMTKKEYTPGDGLTFGLGSHMVDQALVLFGPPTSVTGFTRVNRGVDSEIEDSYTIILQYGNSTQVHKNLVVTVKTSIVSPLKDQLKYILRGMDGSFVKHGTDPQEQSALAAPGKPATDPNYGTEDKRIWGTLSTFKEVDGQTQSLDEESKLYIGKYPSLPGWYRGYYEDLVKAIDGKAPPPVTPEDARDGLRIIELARESSQTGRTLPFSVK